MKRERLVLVGLGPVRGKGRMGCNNDNAAQKGNKDGWRGESKVGRCFFF